MIDWWGAHVQDRRQRMQSLADELKQAWRESGACASYNEPYGAGTRRCAACGKDETSHRLLKWAERIEGHVRYEA